MNLVSQDIQTSFAKLDSLMQDDSKQHFYRLDRSAFTDEELFELEMKYIFEGN